LIFLRTEQGLAHRWGCEGIAEIASEGRQNGWAKVQIVQFKPLSTEIINHRAEISKNNIKDIKTLKSDNNWALPTLLVHTLKEALEISKFPQKFHGNL